MRRPYLETVAHAGAVGGQSIFDGLRTKGAMASTTPALASANVGTTVDGGTDVAPVFGAGFLVTRAVAISAPTLGIASRFRLELLTACQVRNAN